MTDKQDNCKHSFKPEVIECRIRGKFWGDRCEYCDLRKQPPIKDKPCNQ